MPTRSRNARTKARQKLNLSRMRKTAKLAAFHANRNLAIILALLTEAGGSVDVTGETVAKVTAELGQTQFNLSEIENGGFTISLQRTVDASTLSQETLDELKTRMDAAHNEVPVYEPPAGSVTAELAQQPVDPTDLAGDPA